MLTNKQRQIKDLEPISYIDESDFPDFCNNFRIAGNTARSTARSLMCDQEDDESDAQHDEHQPVDRQFPRSGKPRLGQPGQVILGRLRGIEPDVDRVPLN